MDSQSKFIPVQLDNGAIIKIEARTFNELIDEGSGETGDIVHEDITSVVDQLKEVKDAIEGISETLKGSLHKAKPSKATVDFGIELGYESGIGGWVMLLYNNCHNDNI